MLPVQVVLARNVVAVRKVVHFGEFHFEPRAIVQTVLIVRVGLFGAEFDLGAADSTGTVDGEPVGGPTHLRGVTVFGLAELVKQTRGRDVAVVARI